MLLRSTSSLIIHTMNDAFLFVNESLYAFFSPLLYFAWVHFFLPYAGIIPVRQILKSSLTQQFCKTCASYYSVFLHLVINYLQRHMNH